MADCTHCFCQFQTMATASSTSATEPDRIITTSAFCCRCGQQYQPATYQGEEEA